MKNNYFKGEFNTLPFINTNMGEVKLTNSFDSFCSRMWLDYEDEHITNPNRLTFDEYKERWHDWLLEKWQNRDYKDESRSRI